MINIGRMAVLHMALFKTPLPSSVSALLLSVGTLASRQNHWGCFPECQGSINL